MQRYRSTLYLYVRLHKRSLARTFAVHIHVAEILGKPPAKTYVCNPNRILRMRVWRTTNQKTIRSILSVLAQIFALYRSTGNQCHDKKPCTTYKWRLVYSTRCSSKIIIIYKTKINSQNQDPHLVFCLLTQYISVFPTEHNNNPQNAMFLVAPFAPF